MARIKYDADSAAAVRAQKALNTALDDMDKKAEKGVKRLSAAEKAAKRLAAQADPQQRFNDKMERLAVAVKKGGLETGKATQLTKKYQQQLDGAGNAGKKAFGGAMLSNIAGMASGMLSVGAAVGFVSRGFAAIEQEAQAAADAVLNSLGSLGELQQISATPEEFAKSAALGRSLVRRGVFDTPTQGFDFAAAVKNAGFSDEGIEDLVTIGERAQVKPEGLIGLARSTKKVQNLFKKEGGIGVGEAADKILVTSKFTQANAAATAEATTKIAQLNSALEFSGNAGLAGLAAIEQVAGNIAEAATQQSALLNAISRKGLGKKTFAATIDAIDARIKGGEGRFDVLGEANAVKAFEALISERDTFDSAFKQLGSAKGAFGAKNFLPGDREGNAALRRKIAAGDRKDAIREFTTQENLLQTAKDELSASLIRDNHRFRAFLSDVDINISDGLLNERPALQRLVGNERVTTETRIAIAEELKRTVRDALPFDTRASEDRKIKGFDDMIDELRASRVAAEQTARNTAGNSTRGE